MNRKIPATVRNVVWLKYVNKEDPKCFCCKIEKISKGNFECGHIISHKEGGKINIQNLRPICSLCNKSMGKMDMLEFMNIYGFNEEENKIQSTKHQKCKSSSQKRSVIQQSSDIRNKELHKMLDNKIQNYNIKHISVNDIIKIASKIELKPSYQRGNVWDEETMGEYINSVMLDIIPTSLVIHVEGEQRECVDGLQRITSLMRFRKNKIYTKIGGKRYFYSKKHNDYIDDKTTKIFDTAARNIFLKRKILIVEYTDISYEKRADIFKRLQGGMALKASELITGMFTSIDICREFIKFCRKKEEVLSIFLGNIERGKHIKLITELMYMVNKNKLKILNGKEKDAFIKSIKTIEELNKYTSNIDKLIDIYFGKKLLKYKS